VEVPKNGRAVRGILYTEWRIYCFVFVVYGTVSSN
jgi:hypothetical protein